MSRSAHATFSEPYQGARARLGSDTFTVATVWFGGNNINVGNINP